MMIIKLEGNFICFTETTISIETEVDVILILSETEKKNDASHIVFCKYRSNAFFCGIL